LSVVQISTFVSTFFIGALVLQFPIGWLSDRMDRRLLILVGAAICGSGAVVGMTMGSLFPALLLAGLMVGGMSNPLYSLLIAYTNDFLEHDDMAAAAGGMVSINGLGAVLTPVVTGWLMGRLGPWAFFLVIAVLGFGVAAYAAYRMTQRAAPSVEETESFTMVAPSASPMAVSFATDHDYEAAQDETDAAQA